MDRCPKDEATAKNLVCKKALPIPEKNWKNLLGEGVASTPLAIRGLMDTTVNLCSFGNICAESFKGKVHPKNMLVSDVRSDKTGKNAVDHFSLSPLVLKTFAFKVEELLIWRHPF